MPGSKSFPADAPAAEGAAPLGLAVHAVPVAQALMDSERTRRGRRTMVLVLLLCLAPVLASYFTFYVQEQGARVGKSGERLTVVKEKKTVGGARLREVSQLVLMGNVQVSAQALHLMMEKGIPVVHFSTGGWFHGISHGIGIENAYARAAQYEAAADPLRCVKFARDLVLATLG